MGEAKAAIESVDSPFGKLLKTMDLGVAELEMLFRALDGDQSGGISLAEFVDGISKMKDSDRTLLLWLRHDSSHHHRNLVEIKKMLSKMDYHVTKGMKHISQHMARGDA